MTEKKKLKGRFPKQLPPTPGYPAGVLGWSGWGAAVGWTSQDSCLSGAQFGDSGTAGTTTSGDSGSM